ncbi:MAG: cytochrome c [Perlucidibaca sp.]
MKPAIVTALLLAAALPTQAAPSAEDQIRFRKAAYSFISWNMGRIKEQVADGASYDPQQVQAAANAIAGVAGSGLGALFGPGTEQSVGAQKTRARPELFSNLPDVARLGQDFNKAAALLAEEAASGDKARVKAAFGQLGRSCKGCHDKYRGD